MHNTGINQNLGGLGSMVEISGFRGIIYNQNKIQVLDDVMSPPYDIISEDMQNQLYEKHIHNFVKLILGKQQPNDTETNNRYTRAHQLFTQWLQEHILIQSEKEAIYPYKIQFTLNNIQKTMNGFFTLLKIDPTYTQVKAHEHTLSKPKADRLNLMRACHANLEPIQLLYIDEKDIIRATIDKNLSEPIINVQGYDGFTHTLWKIDQPEIIKQIKTYLQNQNLFIADGHHRYQTAINYAQEQQKQTEKNILNASYNYRMVILANIFDKGLAILPTHRLIQNIDINLEDLTTKLQSYFVVEKKPVQSTDAEQTAKHIMQAIQTKTDHKFALYTKENYLILTLKDEKSMDDFAQDHSESWRKLDVSILHKLVLEKLMNITQQNLEDHVKYTRVDSEAIQQVHNGKYILSFLMNATKIDELKKIAEQGEHMPQKSTYFLPKMLSGLVSYKM